MYSKNKLFLLLVLSLLPGFNRCFSQLHNNKGMLSVDGLVYGYNHDPSKNIFQKGKQFLLEGTLGKVSINVSESEKSLYTTQTNSKGVFHLKMNLGKVYKIELSKKGYAKSILLIDVMSVPPEIAANGIEFSGMELTLNSFLSKDTSKLNLPFGKLYYNDREKSMNFQSGEVKNKKGIFARSEESNTPVSLMKRAVLKNMNNIQNKQKSVQKNNQKSAEEPKTENTNEGHRLSDDTTIHITSKFKLLPWEDQHFTEENLMMRESEIQKAREQLEQDKLNASSWEDLVIIKERERMLNIAVSELAKAKKLIVLQKKLLYLTIGGLLLLCGFLFLIYKS